MSLGNTLVLWWRHKVESTLNVVFILWFDCTVVLEGQRVLWTSTSSSSWWRASAVVLSDMTPGSGPWGSLGARSGSLQENRLRSRRQGRCSSDRFPPPSRPGEAEPLSRAYLSSRRSAGTPPPRAPRSAPPGRTGTARRGPSRRPAAAASTEPPCSQGRKSSPPCRGARREMELRRDLNGTPNGNIYK